VANLVTIHSCITGQSPEEICRDVSNLNTGQYKLKLAEVINEHLEPIRQKINEYENDMEHVHNVLSECSARARQLAEETMQEVRKIVGLK
jgi:tryptophanyl-tRNA synthetase